MLDKIWGAMILIGIGFAAMTGRIGDISDAAFSSAKEAVSLCFTMLGVMALWMGLMEIAGRAGIIEKITKGLEPVICFLFPDIPKEHAVRKDIATNLTANLLGLGWACTPAGLKAMEGLKELSTKGEVATSEMCTFLVLNISSLQLIPVNMIAYRQQYGSSNPAGILMPGLLATAVSTLIGVIFCLIMQKRDKRKV